MPSKSPAQARLMAAAAHTAGGYGGVPQSVGKDFNKADTGGSMLSKGSKGGGPQAANYAEGGAVYGRTRNFMKEPDEFRTDGTSAAGPDKADQDYGKSGRAAGKPNPKAHDKSCTCPDCK